MLATPSPVCANIAPIGPRVAEASRYAVLVHGSAVAIDGQGVLILGPSGAGKSALALDLISRGGVLISDDQVALNRRGNSVIGAAPPAIEGLIEARGIGLIRCPSAQAPIALVVDLGQTETARLPPIGHTRILDVSVPLVAGPVTPHLCPAICLLVRGGRLDPEAKMPPKA